MKKISIILATSLLGTLGLKSQIPNYVPSVGLVAWYDFSGNANDLSGNANNLINTNAVSTTDRFGQVNSAYYFDGTAYLTKSTISQTFNISGEYTFSFWAKKDTSGTGIAMMSGNSSANNFVWVFQGDATNIFKYGTNKQGSSWTWLNGPVVNTGQWEHYVGVYNNKIMTFYKNGTYLGTGTNSYTSVSQSSMPLWIGRGAGTTNFYQGAIDDVGIWNRALTATEIQQLYQNTLSVKDSKIQNFFIAPNPVVDYIIIKTKNNDSFRYNITDQLGRKVIEGDLKGLSDYKIDLVSLIKGIYYLNIEGEKSLKIIKY